MDRGLGGAEDLEGWGRAGGSPNRDRGGDPELQVELEQGNPKVKSVGVRSSSEPAEGGTARERVQSSGEGGMTTDQCGVGGVAEPGDVARGMGADGEGVET